MTERDTDQLIRQLIGGDTAATATIVERAGQDGAEALLLAAAALVRPADPDLLARAGATAVSTQERQLVAIVSAHLAGDRDRLDALVRDHLVDFPGSILAAWIAASAPSRRES